MAYMRKRTTKAGEARYAVYYRTPDGRERCKWFTRRRDADAFIATTEADKVRGTWIDPSAGRVPLDEYGARWIENRPGLRERTRELYRSQWARHVVDDLGAVDLAALTPSMVREWHGRLSKNPRLGPATVAKVYRLLRAVLTTALEDELLARNPCSIKNAGVERSAERPVATVAQVWALADAITPRYRCAVLLAGFCGLRVGELAGLERAHVDLLHGTVRVEQQEQRLAGGRLELGPPKTAAGVRTIALPPPLLPELEEHLARYAAPGPAGRLFTGEKGASLHKQGLHGKWTRARDAVGMPDGFRFHDLRHTAATLTAAEGASTAELMARMGHASPAAALRYQHATRERDEALARRLGERIGRAPSPAPDAAVMPLTRGV